MQLQDPFLLNKTGFPRRTVNSVDADSGSLALLRPFAKGLCVLFVLASIWTSTLGDTRSTLSGRLAPADVVGTIAVVLTVLSSRRLFIPRVFVSYLVFLTSLLGGLIVSLNPQSTLTNILIHMFAGVMFVVLLNLFGDERGLDQLILAIAGATLVASALGIVDLLSSTLGLPKLFHSPYGSSTFRNTGQAGTFTFTMLSVLIPVLVSGYHLGFGRMGRVFVTVATILGSTFLILTVKRAALVGFGVSLALTVVLLLLPGKRFGRSRIGLTLTLLVAAVIVTVGVQYVFESNQALANWYQYKIQKTNLSDITEGEGFLGTNWGNALRAFADHPFFGTGIGAFEGHEYGKHEVHSTYLKMLGETGIVGVAGYMVFFASLVSLFFGRRQYHNRYSLLLRAMLPFVIGNMISWLYTYHVRKREFWIMLAVACIASSLSRKPLAEASSMKRSDDHRTDDEMLGK